MAGGGSDTPVMRQYLAAKQRYPDALLFFRMGDFYELFFEDAVTAARALDLTLTARNKNSDDEIPMAGVPHHAASSYLQRLLDQGFKVAICEQMADPKTVKGLVPRDVVRVVTPAIAYDDLGLQPSKNSFLCAAIPFEGSFGVASLDVSTGEFSCCEAEDLAAAVAEVVRLDPMELLVPASAKELIARVKLGKPKLPVREKPDSQSLVEADRELASVLGKGEADKSVKSDAARVAAAAALAYAKACEPQGALAIARLTFYPLGQTLVMDESTQSHLELLRTMSGEVHGSLISVIDETKTAAGARLLRRRLTSPLLRVAEIRRRQDAVTVFATDTPLRAKVRGLLGRTQDVERLATKIGTGRAQPRDLAALRASLAVLPELTAELGKSHDSEVRAALGGDGELLPPCSDIEELLENAIAPDPPLKIGDGGVIREGYDQELDGVRDLAKGGQTHITELETRLRDTTQIQSLKLRYTRVFGWYIEVTRSHVGKAPATWRRKQTIANGERYTTDELDALAQKLLSAEDRAGALESALYAALMAKLCVHVDRLRGVAQRLAEWDVASALAEVAHLRDYVCPTVDDSRVLELVDCRHPVVERLAAAGRFVPNDITLDADLLAKEKSDRARFWVVTGPNMAGKSTLMRQVALCVVLAQMGSYVPARSARIGVVDRVLTRVGASDNLSRGESTFMVEMKETANVLRRATKSSLVVLDEIGRGTSTYDGLSIAWAVAEYLYDAVKCRAMFATHYHELSELAESRPRCANYSVTAREHDGDLVFFHKLEAGPASRSYGVACARLAGMPEPVLARAKAILSGLEEGKGESHDLVARPQLGLFQNAPPPHPALVTLRGLDPNKLTPIEALNLVATLKELADKP
jgi:DNA mismatch repair protein MutS